MNKPKTKKGLITKLISLILVGVIIYCGWIIGSALMMDKQAAEEVNRVYNIVEKTADENNEFTKESFKALKEQNSDFVGYIKFDSGIIEQPVMQSTDPEYYLYRTFEKKYYESGSIFMDSESKFGDTNIVVYGHNNSYNHDIMFSHLNDIILDQKYYESNDRFTLYTQEDIREYAICYAYYITEEEFQEYDFLTSSFANKEQFNEFMEFPTKNTRIISRNGQIEYGNRFITLQTCKRLNQDVRVIVLAKEVAVREYR